MTWFFYALIPPFLYSSSNILDEYLCKKHEELSGFKYIIAASIVGILSGLAIFAYRPEALFLDPLYAVIFGIFGIFMQCCFIPYMIAIKEDGAGFIAPLWQILPLFIFLIAWLTLGETVTFSQFLVCLVIVTTATIASIDHTGKFRLCSLLLMLLSCLLLASHMVFMRFYSQNFHWLDIAAWGAIGAGIGASVFMLIHTPTRKSIYQATRNSGTLSVFLLTLQAALDIGANAFLVLAFSTAPSAGIVQTINALQPFIITFFAILAYWISPHIFAQPPKGKILLWRLACFSIIATGIAFLGVA
ncbi:MAG: hypothetical protein OXR68_07590 [Alphaproteobacteria bacterium]|nr:hypothetical protein [Alphaproteobacteria bacterium]MDD9920466.1 hypothetical protein [Alphaproteobacteria bacterium]